MIIGWAMDDNYKTPLITKAIRMAARNVDLPEGAIFHSDRGSNYTSAEYAGVLEGLGIRQSVGRTGICYDNALAESVNGTAQGRAGPPHSVRDTKASGWKTLHATSSSAIIGLVFTQHSATGLRKKSWTSCWKCRQPRK